MYLGPANTYCEPVIMSWQLIAMSWELVAMYWELIDMSIETRCKSRKSFSMIMGTFNFSYKH
jgi:hypothetical protein